jgi:hypothetical protein
MAGIDKYTVLMLHMQGANNGTSFPDSSFVNPKTVTPNGDVVTSTAVGGPFGSGGSAAYFDGSGCSLTIPESSDFDFGTGDFAIDLWVNWAGTAPNYQTFVGSNGPGFSGNASYFRVWGTGMPGGAANEIGIGAVGGDPALKSSSTLTPDEWVYCEVDRQDGVLYLFIGGVLVGTCACSLVFNFAYALGTIIGNSPWDGGNGDFKGYLAEIRVSNVARHTANFTPPTAPYYAGFTAGSGGAEHSLLLRADGVVFAAGDNTDGQLGDGTNTQRTSFEQITGLSAITAVAAGGYHSLALDSSGNVWATGLNNHGQLGQGNTTNLNVWTQITALSSIASIAAGEYHSMAVDVTGGVWAWGYDSSGQLGDGLTADRDIPYQVM